MKALSVRQPWAWLLFHGKPVENRDWSTNYKGPLAIAASASSTQAEWEEAVDFVRRFDPALAAAIPPRRMLTHGCVVGVVEQVGCVERHSSPFFVGRFGHEYTEAREFSRPCPVKGALGFFEWSPVGGLEQYLTGGLRL